MGFLRHLKQLCKLVKSSFFSILISVEKEQRIYLKVDYGNNFSYHESKNISRGTNYDSILI